MIGNFVDPVHQATDGRALLTLIVLNDVLRNGDAHLKSFSLLCGEDSAQPRPGLVYDVLTAQTWIRGDTPALPILASDPPVEQGLDSRGLGQLHEVAGLADARGAHRAHGRQRSGARRTDRDRDPRQS